MFLFLFLFFNNFQMKTTTLEHLDSMESKFQIKQ